jgi:hypothetical protein
LSATPGSRAAAGVGPGTDRVDEVEAESPPTNFMVTRVEVVTVGCNP